MTDEELVQMALDLIDKAAEMFAIVMSEKNMSYPEALQWLIANLEQVGERKLDG